MHNDASLNIRQLQVFEAVARLESYSRAQQELGISVSAISNAMSQLEGQLGFTLCQRGRGGFSLTEKGQQFLQQAIRVLSELNELERQSALLKGEHSGTLCISTLDSIETETALSLPVVLRSFSDKFPHVHIKLIIRTPAEQLNGVLNNHIDLAIGIQYAGHQPGKTELPHHADIAKHRGELLFGVAEIAAARANDRMHREGNRLADRDQHPIRGC